jgi:hypothetical protein
MREHHRGGIVMREHHRGGIVMREHHRGGNVLREHHRGGIVMREHHRGGNVLRADARLHIDRVCRDCQLVSLHLFAAVCPRDSKYRYCDHYFSQRRDQILPYFGNLNLVVRAILLCLLWTLV